MAVTVYKKPLSNGREALYLKINHKGMKPHAKHTGLFTGKGKFKDKHAEYTAKVMANKLNLEIAEGEYNISIENSADVFEVMLDLAKGKRKITAAKYINVCQYLKDALKTNKKTIKSINEDDLKNFIKHLEGKGYSNQTVFRYYGVLKTVLNFAMQKGWIKQNPSFSVKYKEIRPIKNFLTREEFLIFESFNVKNFYKDHPTNYKNERGSKLELSKDIFVFACLTGLRVTDSITINKEVDIVGKRIIKNQEKTGELLSLPLLDKAYDILMKYDSDNFPYVSDYRLGVNIQTIAKYLGIKKHITFHTARYTFICNMLAAGVNPYYVKEAAGHRDIKTTMRYAKIVDSAMDVAMKKFEGYINNNF